jgi:ABC-type multidrug transport system fused ATPase/permease subunit
MDRVRRAMDHFPEYRSAVFWTMQDLFRAFPWAMIKLTAFSMLGATLRGAALAGAIKYLSILEKGAPLNLAGMNFAVREGRIIILAVFFLFAAMSLSAWLLYLARSVIADLVADYQVYLLKRALTLFGPVVPEKMAPKDSSEALQFVSSTVTKDAQQMIMLARFLGQALPSLTILMYAFPVIVYINPLLTILLMGLTGLFLPFFYKANIMAYKSNRMARRSGSGANKMLVSLMEDVKDFQYISPQQDRTIERSFKRGDLKDKINSLPVFLRSIAKTEFWSNILLSLSVSLVLAIEVPAALDGETTWALLIAYLLFLRLSVNAFKNLMSFLTKFSRFYPSIHRYQNFVQSALLKPDNTAQLLIKEAAHGISEFRAGIEVQKPVRMALITEIPLSRYTFPYMVKLGTKSDNGIFVSPQDCFFVGHHGLPQRDGSLRSMLNLPGDFSIQDLAMALPADLFEVIKGAFGVNLDRNLDQARWDRLSPAHRAELGMISAMFSPAEVVILDQETLPLMAPIDCKAILDRLHFQKALTVICYPEKILNGRSLDWRFGETLCAVAGCTSDLVALGSPQWVEQNKERILNLLAEEAARVKQRLGSKTGTSEEYEDFDDD